jgi:hypothetical protein
MVKVSSVRKRLDYTGMLTCTVVTENPLGGVAKNIATKNPNTSSTQREIVTVREKWSTRTEVERQFSDPEIRQKEDKCKAITLQAWTGSEGSTSLRLPELIDNRHMKVARLLAISTGRLYLQNIPMLWYSFLSQTESTPGSKCGRKDYVNKKSQFPHWESNPRNEIRIALFSKCV